MQRYLVPVAVALIAVALALAFFFAGYFVRGWVDQERAPIASSVDNLSSSEGQAAPAVQADPSPTVQADATPTPMPTANVSPPSEISADDDPAQGPGDAAVTIIEFSDFQCPFCKRYVDQTLPLILDTYGDRVRYVFRDFPITRLHPQAAQAAEAAQCAFEQGKFWEYHALLFENQGALDVDSLKEHAAGLELDQGAFDACLDSGKYAQEVQDDFDEGRAYGVTGAPAFFVNGRKVMGAKPYADFQQIIEEELAKANGK